MLARDGATIVQLAGRQHTEVSVQHAGTPEASLTIRVGQVLMYVRTQPTAERIAQIWHDATAWALAGDLPARGAARRRRGPSEQGWVQASIVVHTAGVPGGGSHLYHQPSTVLVVAVGEVGFYVRDREALEDCHTVFQTAAVRASEVLPVHDTRLTPEPATTLGLPRKGLQGRAADPPEARAVARARRGPSARTTGAAARTAAAALSYRPVVRTSPTPAAPRVPPAGEQVRRGRTL